MTDRLVIDRLHIDVFGGLSDRRVDLPAESLVVVYGPNEAGKTTLAEFITWLLVGPYGDAAGAQRFGDAHARVGGELGGVLGGQRFEARAHYTIAQRGAPRSDALTVHWGGPFDAAAWRERLGGVDGQVFAAIYRMWGEQLHIGAGIDEQLSQVALGALGGQTDARAVATALAEHHRMLTRGKAKNDETIPKLGGSLREIDERIKAAQANAAVHEQHRGELHALERQLADLDERLVVARTERTRLTTAVSLFDQRARAGEIASELGALEVVPDNWARATKELAGFEEAIEALAAATAAVEAAAVARSDTAAAAGLDPARIDAVELGDADATALAVLDDKRAAALEALEKCQAAIAPAEERARIAEATLEQARLQVPGAPDRAALAAVAPADEIAALQQAIADWSSRSGAVDISGQQLEAARNATALAGHDHDGALQAWERFGLGITAEAWSQRGATTGPAGSRPAWFALVAGVCALVAAVVAVAAAQYLVAGLVVVVGVLAAWSARPSATVGDTDALRSAATALMATREVLDRAQREEQSAQLHFERARNDASLAADRVEQLAHRLGRAIPITSPDDAVTALDRWRQAVDAQGEWSTANGALDQARRAADEQTAALDRLDAEIAALIERSGITGAMGRTLTPAEHLARREGYLAAAAAARRLDAVSDGLRRARARVAAFGPTDAEIDTGIDTGIDALVERARRYSDLDARRNDLGAEHAEIERQMARHRNEDPALEEVLVGAESKAALQARVEQADGEVERLEEQLADVNQSIGGARARLAELASVDELAALAIEEGDLLERRDDLIVEAVACGLAAELVNSVMTTYERQHQPALIAATTDVVRAVSPDWESVIVRPGEGGTAGLYVTRRGRSPLAAARLSTGARALLYLALRIAMADHDAQRRNVLIPLICDDPIVHLDDERARLAMATLATATASGRQVLILTCHGRTVDAARNHGAAIVEI